MHKPYYVMQCRKLLDLLLLCLIQLLMFPGASFADFDTDPFLDQRVKLDAPPIDAISEHIDPFSGNMQIVQTDLHLPGNGGLDLTLMRTYNSLIWNRRGIANPVNVALKDKSPLGIGWTMHMGILRYPQAPGTVFGGNPILELPDGTKQIFFSDKNDVSRLISRDFWTLKKIAVYDFYEHGDYEVRSPEGIIYSFNNYDKAGYQTTDYKAVAQVIKIQNPAKTAAINITYDMTHSGYMTYLKTITDSAGRVITFNYDYTKGQLTSITTDTRTISYAYSTLPGTTTEMLSIVTPPVGNSWQYSYDPTYELTDLTYPSGGKNTYTYDDIVFPTGPGCNIPYRVITQKTTSGRRITGGTWTYAYNSGNSNTTVINGPNVTETHKFWGWLNTGATAITGGNVWRVGLPISKEYNFNGTSYREDYGWSQGTTVSATQISNVNWGGCPGTFIVDMETFAPFSASKTITRDGKTYTTTNSNFNTYGDPQTVVETGDKTRTKSLTYWTNPDKNIVKNKPATQSISGDFTATSTSSWTYATDSGNPTEVTHNGVSKSFQYNPEGNIFSITDANKHTTSYEWTYGRISKATNPIYPVSRVINPDGTIKSETNGRGYTTNYEYDLNTRLKKVSPQVGNPTTFEYPADSSYRKETRGNYWIQHNFDGFVRPAGSLDSKGVTTIIAYNAYGVKDYSDSNIGDKTNYDYFGRPIKLLDKDNYSETYDYSPVSGVTTEKVTDKNNKPYYLTYTAFGNPDEKYLMMVKDQNQKTTTYTRNILGNITGINQGAAISHSFVYDSTKTAFLSSETHPESGTTTYGRDNVGNMTQRTDSAGAKTYVYDEINRLRSITSGSSTISFNYDNADNRTFSGSPSATISCVYDEVNRLKTKNETIAGTAYSTLYGYNDNDYINSITYPSGRVAIYGYNGNNQVTSITGFGGSVTSVQYNTAGLPTSFAYSNGKLNSFTYTNRNLPDTIITDSTVNLKYGYDSRGNTLSITNNLSPSKSQSFLYDDLSRITNFNGAWGNGSYGYDDYGNRTQKTVAGSSAYTYTSNRLSAVSGAEAATYSYNGNGTLSGGSWGGGNYTLTYDVFDNLASFNNATTTLAAFGYDADGTRVSKTSNGKNTIYHYDQGGRILTETNASGAYITDYIYLNGKLVAGISNYDFLPLEPPTELKTTVTSTTSIDLTWTDNAPNETGYSIERKTGADGTYAQAATVGSNVTTYSDTGLTAGGVYYYRVRGIKDSEYSTYSNEASGSTAIPTAPSNSTITATTGTSITLSWTDNSSNETGFAIESKSGAAGTYAQAATVGPNVTTYTNKNLTPGVTYYYRIKALNGNLSSTYSNEVSGTTQTLAAPTNLAATVMTKTRIDLAWTDNSDNETGFVIERKTGTTGTYAQLATVGANTTSYSNTGLSSGKTYYYRIKAINSEQSSVYSNEVSGVTSTPAAPSALKITTITDSIITMSWTDKSSNETGFVIERKNGTTGTYAQLATVGANVTTYSDTPPAEGGTYYYRTKAVNGNLSSAYSNQVSGTTPTPKTPSGLTISTTTTANSIAIKWKDNSSNETGFIIERKTEATGIYARIATVKPNVATYTNTVLTPGVTYYYRVKAVNGNLSSAYSNEASGITSTPAAPSGLTTSTTTNSIAIIWTDNSSNKTGFVIERKTGTTGTYARIATVAANVVTYTNSKLTPGITYYYRVKAVNGKLSSAYSNEASGVMTTRRAGGLRKAPEKGAKGYWSKSSSSCLRSSSSWFFTYARIFSSSNPTVLTQ